MWYVFETFTTQWNLLLLFPSACFDNPRTKDRPNSPTTPTTDFIIHRRIFINSEIIYQWQNAGIYPILFETR